MNYDSQIKKILQILQGENANTLNANSIDKIDLIQAPEHYVKNIVTINLMTGYEMLSGSFYPGGSINSIVNMTSSEPVVLFVSLPNYPEWAIPMSKIIPMAYTEDGFDANQITGNINCQHFWQVLPNVDNQGNSLPNTVNLRIVITLVEDGDNNPIINIPCYVDLNLVFINENIWTEINPNKS
jgi:hypothetical protein